MVQKRMVVLAAVILTAILLSTAYGQEVPAGVVVGPATEAAPEAAPPSYETSEAPAQAAPSCPPTPAYQPAYQPASVSAPQPGPREVRLSGEVRLVSDQPRVQYRTKWRTRTVTKTVPAAAPASTTPVPAAPPVIVNNVIPPSPYAEGPAGFPSMPNAAGTNWWYLLLLVLILALVAYAIWRWRRERVRTWLVNIAKFWANRRFLGERRADVGLVRGSRQHCEKRVRNVSGGERFFQFRSRAMEGDVVEYQLRLHNDACTAIPADRIWITEDLPEGLEYVPGSGLAYINTRTNKPVAVPDWAILQLLAGRTLRMDQIPGMHKLPGQSSLYLVFRASIVGAGAGDEEADIEFVAPPTPASAPGPEPAEPVSGRLTFAEEAERQRRHLAESPEEPAVAEPDPAAIAAKADSLVREGKSEE